MESKLIDYHTDFISRFGVNLSDGKLKRKPKEHAVLLVFINKVLNETDTTQTALAKFLNRSQGIISKSLTKYHHRKYQGNKHILKVEKLLNT
jgi:hypothetical protein